MSSNALLDPLVLGSAVLIVGSVLVALRMTRPGRFRSGPTFGRLGRRDPGSRSAVPADASAGGGDTGYVPERAEPGTQTVTFADVAGLDDAIEEMREVVDYLTNPERFETLGAAFPRGILLYGMPGCGKTLLARALAGETGVPFYFVSASSFVEKFVGMGASRVRQLFESAKKDAPSIVFVDELDAIGRHRAADTSGEREYDHTLNQLLVELDGFTGASGVLIVGATNRPELIDPALLRPGRFDRRIRVDRPDRAGREKILRLHASRRPVSRRVDWADVAANTAGLTAAELASVVNEASLLAARRHRDRVGADDVDEAVNRVLSGTRAGARLLSDEEKHLISVHEAGHAVLSVLLRGVNPPSRVSIVNQANVFGRSPWSSADDREVLTKRELMAQLIVLLGGRAAEMNVFGQPSTRSEDDIEHAAALARRMVERLAMTGRFELADGDDRDRRGGDWATTASQEVRELLVRAEHAARTILRDNDADLQSVASQLYTRETVTSAEITDMLRGRGGMERGA